MGARRTVVTHTANASEKAANTTASASPHGGEPSARKLNAAADVTCPRCASLFTCGASASSCWCQAVPALDLERLPSGLMGRGCLCGGCLGDVVAEQLDP